MQAHTARRCFIAPKAGFQILHCSAPSIFMPEEHCVVHDSVVCVSISIASITGKT
jgi:hypothetical protein